MNELTARLKANVESVRNQITEAAIEAGRSPASVTLVAVTKYVDAATTRALIHAGCNVLGENRPQVLIAKAEEIKQPGVAWHMIGHLQRNKVDKTVRYANLIHSVDSQRLLTAIDQSAEKQGKMQDILLEVNISGDAAKHGWSPTEMPAAIQYAGDLKNIRVRGLMTMAALTGGTVVAERNFEEMHALHQRLAASAPDNVEICELSMGMSRDFQVAIRHGATLVRVGSALFQGVQ